MAGTIDRLRDVTYILIPGRGRTVKGDQLTAISVKRVELAAMLFTTLNLNERDGKIIVTGYKSPADHAGSPRTSSKGIVTQGVPESEMMANFLEKLGIAQDNICIESTSIDTITNLAFAEAQSCFTDNRAVAIIAQKQHLARIIRVIAPRVLRRDYIGVIAPEGSETVDRDSLLVSLTSRIVLLGVSKRQYNPEQLATLIEKRVRRAWIIANFLRRGKSYHQG